jgi:hypothetical protein
MNVTSSINLRIVSRFNGANENGTQTGTVYPIDATRDSLYGNTEEWSGSSNIFPSFKLTELDANTKYSFTFYASRTGVSDNRETGFTITGGNSGFATLNASGNTDETVSVTDITPTTAGEITLALAPTANNDNPYHFTYLGVLRVDALPPQTPIGFTVQPVSQKIVQGKPVTFTAAVTGAPPYRVQWYQDGGEIFGASNFSYTIPATDLSMNGMKFSVSVSNLVYGVLSSNAVLTVSSDTNPPVVLSAASYDGNTILMEFDEPMDFSVYDTMHYQINAGAVTVVSADLDASGKIVTLFLATPITGTFTVLINGVNDAVGNPIAPNTTVTGRAIPLEEQDLLFDFGGNNTTLHGPSPDDPVNYWNNITASIGNSDTGELLNLVTAHNAQTTYGLAMLKRFGGNNDAGTLASTVFPVDATRDSLFGNTEVFQSLSNIFPSFKLTGLNPVKQYSLTFFASRTGVGDNRETGYSISGANSNYTKLNAANNINNTATAGPVSPAASGEITISLAPTAANNNANHFTYIGVLKVSPYVAPPQFLPPVIESGQIKLQWTGGGRLFRSSSPAGTWTEILPNPTSPYNEALVPGENRFYRLQR